MIRNTGREERAPRFPGHRDSATGDSSYGLLRRLRLKARHFRTGVCRSYVQEAVRVGGATT